MNDRPVVGTYTLQDTTITRDTYIRDTVGIRTPYPSQRADLDPRLKTARPLESTKLLYFSIISSEGLWGWRLLTHWGRGNLNLNCLNLNCLNLNRLNLNCLNLNCLNLNCLNLNCLNLNCLNLNCLNLNCLNLNCLNLNCLNLNCLNLNCLKARSRGF